jgi:hypothetical protein
MAYRRTYYIDDLDGPLRDDYTQVGFDLLDYELPDDWALQEVSDEASKRCQRMAKALKLNCHARRTSDRGPGYFAILCQFGDVLKESGISYEMCPNNNGAMVRWYNPSDADKAEKLLREEGFQFSVENDG